MNENAYAEFTQSLQSALEQSSIRGLFFGRSNKRNSSFDAVSIRDNPFAPQLSLATYFADYLNGRSIEDIAKELSEVLNAPTSRPKSNSSNLLPYSTFSTRIFPTLINPKHNQEKLKTMPYSTFLDVAVIYRVAISTLDEVCGFMEVNTSLFKSWGITLEQLHADAMENLKKKNSFTSFGLGGLFLKIMRGKHTKVLLNYNFEDMFHAGANLAVFVSNSIYSNGATALLFPDIFQNAMKKHFPNETSLLLLPSTTHEVIAVPYPKDNTILSRFREIVCSINTNNISAEEILSNENLYCYNRETNHIEIVQETEDSHEENRK